MEFFTDTPVLSCPSRDELNFIIKAIVKAKNHCGLIALKYWHKNVSTINIFDLKYTEFDGMREIEDLIKQKTWQEQYNIWFNSTIMTEDAIEKITHSLHASSNCIALLAFKRWLTDVFICSDFLYYYIGDLVNSTMIKSVKDKFSIDVTAIQNECFCAGYQQTVIEMLYDKYYSYVSYEENKKVWEDALSKL